MFMQRVLKSTFENKRWDARAKSMARAVVTFEKYIRDPMVQSAPIKCEDGVPNHDLTCFET